MFRMTDICYPRSIRFHTHFNEEMTMLRTLALSFVSLCAVTNLFAAKNAPLKAESVKVGAVVVEDAFDRAELGQRYAAPKGDWRIAEGALVGKELAADKHAAVLSYQHPNRDSVIQVSFRLDGTDGFNLSLNHAKGHLFRIIIAGDSMSLRTDQDKKDPKSKSLLLAKAEGKIAQGEWHTLLVEIHGENVAAQLDNGMHVSGSHASLNVDKPNYRFVMKGASLNLDDLKIWNVAE